MSDATLLAESSTTNVLVMPRAQPWLDAKAVAAAPYAFSDIRLLARACGLQSVAMVGLSFPHAVGIAHRGVDRDAWLSCVGRRGRMLALDAAIVSIDAKHGGILSAICGDAVAADERSGPNGSVVQHDTVQDRAQALRTLLIGAGEERFFLDAWRLTDDKHGGVVFASGLHLECDSEPASAHERLEAILGMDGFNRLDACAAVAAAFERTRINLQGTKLAGRG